MEAKVFSVANQKGGVGKSTITTLLASALSDKYKVAVVDCDNQKSITNYRAMEATTFSEVTPPYLIESLNHRFLHDFLKMNSHKYDIIFIDIPRITEEAEGGSVLQILAMCEGVLIPFLGGLYEILSTKNFIKAVEVMANYKAENSIEFKYFGVLNRNSRRSENKETVEYLEAEGLNVFDHSLNNLKVFSTPSTMFSILEDPEGKSRFEPFFIEFCKKFEL